MRSLLVLLLVGCGSSRGPLPPVLGDPDSGASTDGSTSYFKPCAPLALPAGFVDEIQVAEDEPALLGGPLVEGTYALTSWTLYTGKGGTTGPTGEKLQKALGIGPTSLSLTIRFTTGNPAVQGYVFKHASASELDVTNICAQPNTIVATKMAYTASGNTILLYDTSPGLFLFTKQ